MTSQAVNCTWCGKLIGDDEKPHVEVIDTVTYTLHQACVKVVEQFGDVGPEPEVKPLNVRERVQRQIDLIEKMITQSLGMKAGPGTNKPETVRKLTEDREALKTMDALIVDMLAYAAAAIYDAGDDGKALIKRASDAGFGVIKPGE